MNQIALEIFIKLVQVIAIIIIIIVIVYIVNWLRKTYPQPVHLMHSEPFEEYMESLYARVLKHASDANVQAALGGGFNAVRSSVTNPIAWKVFYIFRNEVRNPKGFGLGQNLLLMANPKFVGRPYNASTDRTYVDHIDAFAKLVQSVSNANRLSSTDPETMAKIHELDLLLNLYFKDIQFSYNSRKHAGFTLQFNVVLMYLVPFLEYIFVDRVIPIWKTWDITGMRNRIINAYNSPGIRDAIIRLPVTVAKQGYTNYNGELDETFALLEAPSFLNNSNHQTETRETFLGPLFKIPTILSSIGKFFSMIPVVAGAMIKIVTNPFRLIFVLVAWLFCFLIMVIYFVVGALLGLLSFVIAPIFLFWIKWIQTILWIVLAVLMIAIYSIIWLMDLLTGGLVLALLRCENLPNAWYAVPGYALGNQYRRYLFCHGTCGNRYSPAGLFCKRVHALQPGYCPQQLIAQYYHSNRPDVVTSTKPFFFNDDMTNTPKFWISGRGIQEEMLVDVFRARKSFLTACKKKLEPHYDKLTLATCKHVFSKHPNTEEKPDDKPIQVLKMLCKQAYCIDIQSGSYQQTRGMDPRTGPICNDSMLFNIEDQDEHPHIFINTLSMMIILMIMVIALVAISTLSPFPMSAVGESAKLDTAGQSLLGNMDNLGGSAGDIMSGVAGKLKSIPMPKIPGMPRMPRISPLGFGK